MSYLMVPLYYYRITHSDVVSRRWSDLSVIIVQFLGSVRYAFRNVRDHNNETYPATNNMLLVDIGNIGYTDAPKVLDISQN